MQYQSETYSTPSSLYIKNIMLAWLKRRAWIFIAVLGICVALAVMVDVAFILVGLMFIFIILPGVLAFVYFNYGMKPEALRWGRSHRFIISDSSFTIVSLCDDEHDYSLPDEVIPLDEIRGFRALKRMTLITHGNALDGFVIIPDDAFGENVVSSREAFHRFLYDTIQRNCVTLPS